MTRDPPDSGSGRVRGRLIDPPSPRYADHTRTPTRPGPHVVPGLDDTEDDFPGPLTPVEHLISRVGKVEEVVADHAATIAERHEMPSSEAWQRLEDTVYAIRSAADRNTRELSVEVVRLGERVKICEDEREKRGRWALLLKIAKGIGVGGLGTALVWAVVSIGDAGAAREAAARDKATAREVFQDVRALREQFAADHALLQLLVSRFAPP